MIKTLRQTRKPTDTPKSPSLTGENTIDEHTLMASLRYRIVHEFMPARRDKRFNAICDPDPDTCQNVFTSKLVLGDKFGSWLRFETKEPCNVCWISGDPGSGKSVLMKHVVQSLTQDTTLLGDKRMPDEQDRTVLSHFFDPESDRPQRSFIDMVQNLLLQLFAKYPAVVDKAFVKSCKRNSYKGVWETWNCAGDKWLFEVIRDALEIALGVIEKELPVYIFIDGPSGFDWVDVTRSQVKNHGVEAFCDFIHMLRTLSGTRVCVATRPEGRFSTWHNPFDGNAVERKICMYHTLYLPLQPTTRNTGLGKLWCRSAEQQPPPHNADLRIEDASYEAMLRQPGNKTEREWEEHQRRLSHYLNLICTHEKHELHNARNKRPHSLLQLTLAVYFQDALEGGWTFCPRTLTKKCNVLADAVLQEFYPLIALRQMPAESVNITYNSTDPNIEELDQNKLLHAASTQVTVVNPSMWSFLTSTDSGRKLMRIDDEGQLRDVDWDGNLRTWKVVNPWDKPLPPLEVIDHRKQTQYRIKLLLRASLMEHIILMPTAMRKQSDKARRHMREEVRYYIHAGEEKEEGWLSKAMAKVGELTASYTPYHEHWKFAKSLEGEGGGIGTEVHEGRLFPWNWVEMFSTEKFKDEEERGWASLLYWVWN